MELRGAFALAPRSQSDSKPTPAAAPCCCCLSPTFVRSARTLPTSTGALHKPNRASSLRQRLGLGPRGMMQHGRRAAGELSGSNSNRIPHSNDSQQARRNHAAIRTQQGRPASPAAPRRAPDPPRSPPAPCPHSPAPRGPAQARCGAARGGSGAGAGLGRAPRRSEGCGLRAAPQGAAAAPQAGGVLQAAFGVLSWCLCPVPSQPVPAGEGSPSLLCAPCQRSAGSRLHPATFWPSGRHEPLSALGLGVSGVLP